MFGTSVQWIAGGIVVGLIGGVLMTRGLAQLLTQLTPGDPGSFGAAVGVLLGAALAGSYLPARRAMRIDPMVAMRREG